MLKKILSILLLIILLLPNMALAEGNNTVSYHIDGNSVTVAVKGHSHTPINIAIQADGRKYFIDQEETDANGEAVFSTSLEEGKDYDSVVYIEATEYSKKISIKPDNPVDPEQPEKPATAYLYIKGYKGVILSKTQAEINEGETVLDFTKRVLDAKDIDYNIKSGGYVAGFAGQEEFDKGPKSGWMFTLNEGFPGVGAGSTRIKDGDYIKWLYTTDLGKDIGNIYEGEEEQIIEDALALLDEKSLSESEICKILDDVAGYTIDAVKNLKGEDVENIISNFTALNQVFVKALNKLDSEDALENAAAHTLNVGGFLADFLDLSDNATTANSVLNMAAENLGLTLACVNKMHNKDKIEVIVEDMLDLSVDLNKKVTDKEPESSIKQIHRFSVKIPQAFENNVNINLPAILLTKGREKGVESFDLYSHILDVRIPYTALSEDNISEGFIITGEKIDRSILSEEVTGLIPRESQIVDINRANSDGFLVPIEVGIPFNGDSSNSEAITSFILDDTGQVSPVGGIYDSESRKVRFLTTHFSKYFAKKSQIDFSDTLDHWAKNQIGILAGKGIIKGKDENVFQPNSNITRAEFTALVVRTLGYAENIACTMPFTDITKNDWHYNHVAIAYMNGLINGKSKQEFDPNGSITRQEMAQIISNILERKYYKRENTENLRRFTDFAEIDSWATEGIALCLQEEIITGKGNGDFAPKENATRAEASVILYRLYDKIFK